MKRTTTPDRLARDAMAAQAAGLSYGQYKAQHPYSPEPLPEEQLQRDREDGGKELVCRRCGGTFLAYGRDTRRKYCSGQCLRDAAAARYLLLHPRKMEPCAVCGRMIDPFHGRK